MKDQMGSIVRRFFVEEDGQSTTEYMLLMGVIALGIIVAGFAFVDPFRGGVKELANKFKSSLSSGKLK